jgi:hypothetical protein
LLARDDTSAQGSRSWQERQKQMNTMVLYKERVFGFIEKKRGVASM